MFRSPSFHVAAHSPTTATARRTPVPITSPIAFDSSKNINSADAVVAFLILTSRFSVKYFGTLQLRLPCRVVVVYPDGVLVYWHVSCQEPTIITEIKEPGTVDRTTENCRLSKTYSEMVHDLFKLLNQKFVVFYDRDGVLDALQMALPCKHTLDIGHNIHIRHDALRAGGSL